MSVLRIAATVSKKEFVRIWPTGVAVFLVNLVDLLIVGILHYR